MRWKQNFEVTLALFGFHVVGKQQYTLYYEIQSHDQLQQVREDNDEKASENCRLEGEMRGELEEAVSGFLNELDFTKAPKLTDEQRK